jgi:hypothetical protein
MGREWVAFRLGAVEDAVQGIEESIGREWVAFRLGAVEDAVKSMEEPSLWGGSG